MALLRKIKSATLIEVLVATVLIVIIFMIASLVLNNLLLNTLSKKTHHVEYRIHELEYSFQNGNIALPYEETFEDWEVEIKKENDNQNVLLVITAVNGKTDKEIVKKQIYAQ